MKIIDIDDSTVLAYEFTDKNMLPNEQHQAAYRLLDVLLDECYGLDLSKLEITENSHGKPCFKEGVAEFNITHTKGLVSCIICGNGMCGVDAELIKDVRENTYKRFMTDEEAKVYEKLDGSLKNEYFFKIWTLKEARVKAYGTGIDSEFKNAGFIPGEQVSSTDWNFWYYQWQLQNGDDSYVISAAVEK